MYESILAYTLNGNVASKATSCWDVRDGVRRTVTLVNSSYQVVAR